MPYPPGGTLPQINTFSTNPTRILDGFIGYKLSSDSELCSNVKGSMKVKSILKKKKIGRVVLSHFQCCSTAAVWPMLRRVAGGLHEV